MRYKNIIKPILFIAGILILLNVLSCLFIQKYSIEVGSYKKINEIFSEPKNTIDYLVIGDSESDSSISPMEIWKKYGYTGYNCGIPGQKLQDTYYMLEELLHNQSPKVILLETNAFYRNFGFFTGLQNMVDGTVRKFLPIYKYHDQWKNLNFDSFKNIDLMPNYTWSKPFKGYTYNAAVVPYTKGVYIQKTQKAAKINRQPLFYLNKIVNLCDEHNIQLILYSVPSPLCWTYAKHKAAAAFAKKSNVPFVDLNLRTEKLKIDWLSDTRDKGNHMNFYGAKKVTKYMGKYLSKHYNLTDHRQEEKYASWNNVLEEYLKQTNQLN